MDTIAKELREQLVKLTLEIAKRQEGAIIYMIVSGIKDEIRHFVRNRGFYPEEQFDFERHCLGMIKSLVNHFDHVYQKMEAVGTYGYAHVAHEFYTEDQAREYGRSEQFLVDKEIVKAARYFKDIRLAFVKSKPEHSLCNFNPNSELSPIIRRETGEALIKKIHEVLKAEYLIKTDKGKGLTWKLLKVKC